MLVSPQAPRSDGATGAAIAYTGHVRAVITTAYFGSFFGIGICLASLGPILPALASRTGSSIDDLGVLFVFRSVGSICGSITSGLVVERIKRTHLLLLVGNCLCAAGCLLLPSLQSVPALGAVVLTQGSCMGMLDTAGNVMLIWLHGSNRVEPYMQSMHFCFAVGALLSPLLIEASTRIAHNADGFAGAFYLMGASLFASSLPLLTTRGPRPPAAAAAAALDTSTEDGQQAAAASAAAPQPLMLGRASPLKSCPPEMWLVASSALCLALYVGCEVGYGGFIFTFAVTELRIAEAPARGLNSLYWSGLALGRLAAIPGASRFRPHVILYGGLAGALAAAAVLAMLPPLPHDTSGGGSGGSGGALVWIATAALGFCHAPVFPTVLTHAERHMRLSGRVASAFSVSGSVGEALLPMLIAVAYTAEHASFPRIIVGASAAQLLLHVAARAAVHRIDARTEGHDAQKQQQQERETETRTVVDGAAGDAGLRL